MATTAGGTYYAASTETLTAYPALSLNLANQLESRLAAKAALAGATYTGTHDFAGATVTGLAAAGLTLITTQSFTTASAVNVNNCFTSTYDNYLVLLDVASVASGTVEISARMRVSGVDATTGYTKVRILGSGSAASSDTAPSAPAGMVVGYGNSVNFGSGNAISLFAPALTRPTKATGMFIVNDGGTTYAITGISVLNNSTAYDGISIIPSASTLTGTISVYGYKK